MPELILEACVDSVDGALAAREGGARRVELCAGLFEGGTTPSAAAIELTVKLAGLPVHVLIRPRGGDFCYSATELEVMTRDIEIAKGLGASGAVFGVLRQDGTIDRERTGELVRLSRPMSVTFHRAFDGTPDAFEALEGLVAMGVDRVLTSGQERTALEGLHLIKNLVLRARGRIIVLPGGGIDEGNVAQIVRRAGVYEVHTSARGTAESRMVHRNPRCFLGAGSRAPEDSHGVTDAARVAAMLRAVRQDARGA